VESNFFGSSLPTPPQPPFGFQVSVSVSPVAEPSSMVLLATGLIAAATATYIAAAHLLRAPEPRELARIARRRR